MVIDYIVFNNNNEKAMRIFRSISDTLSIGRGGTVWFTKKSVSGIPTIHLSAEETLRYF